MLKNVRTEVWVALLLVAPFVAIYIWMFIYPTIQMVQLSFTDAPLVGPGEWVGWANYERLFSHRVFKTAIWNTTYFVLLTVIPGTLVALMIALAVSRLNGWVQSLVLALFFLPYILPISVIYLVWGWIMDFQYGIVQYFFKAVLGQPIAVFRQKDWVFPTIAVITIWWTAGFSILLFLAGLRAISKEIYEAASLDNANRWTTFWRITWPLIWPITVLVLTIQLILQLKIFDQVYLFTQGGRTNVTMVLVQYIYQMAFVNNKGGYAASAAVVLFAIIVVFSVLQFQLLRARGQR